MIAALTSSPASWPRSSRPHSLEEFLNTKLRSVTRLLAAPGGAPSAAKNLFRSFTSKRSEASSTRTMRWPSPPFGDRVGHRTEARRLVPVAAEVRERGPRVGEPRRRRHHRAAHVAHAGQCDRQRPVGRQHAARAVGPFLPAHAEQPLGIGDAHQRAGDQPVAGDLHVGSPGGPQQRPGGAGVGHAAEALDEGGMGEDLAVGRIGRVAHSGSQRVEVGLRLQLERQVQRRAPVGRAGVMEPGQRAERNRDAGARRTGDSARGGEENRQCHATDDPGIPL